MTSVQKGKGKTHITHILGEAGDMVPCGEKQRKFRGLEDGQLPG